MNIIINHEDTEIVKPTFPSLWIDNEDDVWLWSSETKYIIFLRDGNSEPYSITQNYEPTDFEQQNKIHKFKIFRGNITFSN